MANTEKEAILIMLLTETVRRLTKTGKNPIHITNGHIQMNLENGFEVEAHQVAHVLAAQKLR